MRACERRIETCLLFNMKLKLLRFHFCSAACITMKFIILTEQCKTLHFVYTNNQRIGTHSYLTMLVEKSNAIDTWSLLCMYMSEAWHTGVVNNNNSQNFLLLYQIGLKLSVRTVLTSRQIRWSPNFSHTIDSDTIRKWQGGASAIPVP